MTLRALISQNAVGEGPGILGEILDRRKWDRETIHLYHSRSVCSLLYSDSRDPLIVILIYSDVTLVTETDKEIILA